MDNTPNVNTSPLVAIATRPDGTVFVKPRFVWDANRYQAAMDLAEGQHRMVEIARRAGTDIGSLGRWRQHPDFREQVEKNREVFREQVLSFGIADKTARIAALQQFDDHLEAIREARAAMFLSTPTLAGVPGGDTGYVYEHPTASGVEYRVDDKMIARRQDIRKQAAIERGEWNEGNGPAVAVQIVCPASAPDVNKAPTVTIGSRQ